MGVVHFDPKDILRENEVGLWMMRINREQKHCELHVDETMEHLLGADMKYTSTECSDYWFSNIHKDYTDAVEKCINEMMSSKNAVQTEFVWCHPEGDIWVRFSGKRVKDSDGMVVLEGYYRNITNVTGAKGEAK